MLNLLSLDSLEGHVSKRRRAITAVQVAKWLGVNRMTVLRYRREGQLEGYKLSPGRNAAVYIYVDSLIDFMRRSGREIPPELLDPP